MGGRIVWMPTYSAKADKEAKGLDGGISLLDSSGSLVPEIHPILETIKSHDMVLATGHISTAALGRTTFAFFGFIYIFVNHNIQVSFGKS